MKYDIVIQMQVGGRISDVFDDFDDWDFMTTSMLRVRLLTIFGFGYDINIGPSALDWDITENGLELATLADMFLDNVAA